MYNPLHSRATSGFALSVATGLAMESVFTVRQEVIDPERVTPPRVDLHNYRECWINVQTLIRNIYNACERTDISKLKPQDVYEVADQEMDLIIDLFKNEGAGLVKPVFFFNDYQELFKGPKEVYLRREDRTALQRQARYIFLNSASLLYRERKDIQSFKLNLSGNGTNALVLSHIPADLLSHRRFNKLDLLESHTGKVKPPAEWYSKYYPIPDTSMERLPFCRQLLGILGDSVLVSPGPLKARKEIMGLAKSKNWTPYTSPNKVNTDLASMLDTYLSTVIRSIPVY